MTKETSSLFKELQEEAKKLKSHKAPGPDRIPNEILKIVVKKCPTLLLDTFNDCLRQGIFPTQWKIQNLALLKKENKPPEVSSSYRPICLLDTMGKLMEALILRRLRSSLENKYSIKQYGFRKGKSTVDAILAAIDIIVAGKNGRKARKGSCAGISLDIKNAFNSARWIDLITSLVKKEAPEYILRIIEDYLNERKIIYGELTMEMSGGVAQGSRMGPDLWNAFYDDFLEQKLPEDSTVLGFADDSLLLAWEDDEDLLEMKVNESLFLLERWLKKKKLQLAVHKTEAVLITDRRKFKYPNIYIGKEKIEWKKQLTYLGVEIDHKLSFGPHIVKVCEKALKTASTLARIMPNVKGPSEMKRRVLCSTVYSQLLYAAPVWYGCLSRGTIKKKVYSVQRILAMRIISAYRTISTCAAMVLSSTIPLDIQAEERNEIYHTLQGLPLYERNLPQVKNEIRKTARKKAEERWQQIWSNEEKGRWTYELIKYVDQWMNRRQGNTNYYLTQAFSGHGCFKAYLKRFKITQDSNCDYCDNE